MRRALRYAIACLVAAGATVGVAAVTPDTEHRLILLVGIAQVYAVGTAIALRYPSAFWGSDGRDWTSGAFAGVTTFGTVTLMNGVESDPNIAAGTLGWGLAVFGLVVGIAFERERDADDDSDANSSSDDDDAESSPKERDGASSD